MWYLIFLLHLHPLILLDKTFVGVSAMCFAVQSQPYAFLKDIKVLKYLQIMQSEKIVPNSKLCFRFYVLVFLITSLFYLGLRSHLSYTLGLCSQTFIITPLNSRRNNFYPWQRWIIHKVRMVKDGPSWQKHRRDMQGWQKHSRETQCNLCIGV